MVSQHTRCGGYTERGIGGHGQITFSNNVRRGPLHPIFGGLQWKTTVAGWFWKKEIPSTSIGFVILSS